jgi:hypothetical protein
MPESTEGVTVLVLRDTEGNLYLLDEDAIRACRATAEQQETLNKVVGEQDVAGFVTRVPSIPGGLDLGIVVAPQINVATGINTVGGINLGSISQGVGQGQGNTLNNLFAFTR